MGAAEAELDALADDVDDPPDALHARPTPKRATHATSVWTIGRIAPGSPRSGALVNTP